MHTNTKQTTLTYFDRTAADYNTSHDGKFVRPMYRTVLEEALSLPWRDVLDIGCGNGNLLAALLEARPEAHYHGVDLSPNMAAEARRRLGDGVSIQVGDAEHLPCASASFDLLICNAVFHHCTAPEKERRPNMDAAPGFSYRMRLGDSAAVLTLLNPPLSLLHLCGDDVVQPDHQGEDAANQ